MYRLSQSGLSMSKANGYYTANGLHEEDGFFSFAGKRAVVIGGTSGMGLAAAQLFVKLGGEVNRWSEMIRHTLVPKRL